MKDKDDWFFDAIPKVVAGVFIAIVLCWIGIGALVAYIAVTASPEGAGQLIGRFLRGIDEGRK